jgi:altronate dehydratase small subunit
MADQYIKVVENKDNVATAIREVSADETIEIAVGDDTRTIKISDDVPFGHKIAIEDIAEGDTVYKYAKSIGNASQDIEAGEWVHVHNVESNYGRGDLKGDKAAAGGD